MNFARPLLLLLCAFVAAAFASPAPPSLAQTIKANRWKKRILLVVAPTAADPDYQRQKTLLAAAPAGLRERDFLVLDVLYDQLSAADQRFLQQEMELPNRRFAVVLIGKDGGVKQTKTRPIATAELFGTVDSMPMRRQEMRR
jgi:hypothetical protein